MSSWVAWLIAAVSTTAFLVLWCWEVRRVLRSRRSVVESAAAQLAACRRQAAGVRYDPELAQILARSESIYRQAVAHYNDALQAGVPSARPSAWLRPRHRGGRPLTAAPPDRSIPKRKRAAL